MMRIITIDDLNGPYSLVTFNPIPAPLRGHLGSASKYSRFWFQNQARIQSPFSWWGSGWLAGLEDGQLIKL